MFKNLLTPLKRTLIVIISIWSVMFVILPAFAEVMDESTLEKPNMNSTALQDTAKEWGLSVEDYQLYLREMQDSPSQLWWKNLDPPQVLGLNAKSDAERMKYAEIDVQLDQLRVSKEIAFQHAYDQAFKSLYPNAKVIDIPANQLSQAASSVIQANDHLYLFIKSQDAQSNQVMGQLMQQMQMQSNVILNIFFVGDTSFEDIQHWAVANNLPQNESFANGSHITLNHNEQHGNNMLDQLYDHQKVSLPLLIRVRNEHSEVIPGAALQGAAE